MIWVGLVLVGLLAAGLLWHRGFRAYQDWRIRGFRRAQAWREYKQSKR